MDMCGNPSNTNVNVSKRTVASEAMKSLKHAKEISLTKPILKYFNNY